MLNNDEINYLVHALEIYLHSPSLYENTIIFHLEQIYNKLCNYITNTKFFSLSFNASEKSFLIPLLSSSLIYNYNFNLIDEYNHIYDTINESNLYYFNYIDNDDIRISILNKLN